MSLKDSKWLWYGVTTLIFAGLIYLADLTEFLDALISAKLTPFTVALVLGLSFFVSNAAVWYLFLKEGGTPVSFWKALKLFLGGNFLNSVTPLGQFGGEPLMAYVVSRNTDANYQESISSIISADLVNTTPFITYSAVGILYLVLIGDANNLIIKSGFFLLLLTLIGSVIVYLLWFEEKILENLLFKFLEEIEKIIGGKKYIESARKKIKESLQMFKEFGKNPKHLITTSLIGHTTVVTQILCLYFILLSLNVEPLIAPITLTVVLSGLATFSPTPGGSGTFEAGFTGIMVLLMPVKPSTALAAAVLFRLTTYWPGIPLGYLALLSLENDS